VKQVSGKQLKREEMTMTNLENRLALQLERMVTVFDDLSKDKSLDKNYVLNVLAQSCKLLAEVEQMRAGDLRKAGV
jgi:hypothetical protein